MKLFAFFCKFTLKKFQDFDKLFAGKVFENIGIFVAQYSSF